MPRPPWEYAKKHYHDCHFERSEKSRREATRQISPVGRNDNAGEAILFYCGKRVQCVRVAAWFPLLVFRVADYPRCIILARLLTPAKDGG